MSVDASICLSKLMVAYGATRGHSPVINKAVEALTSRVPSETTRGECSNALKSAASYSPEVLWRRIEATRHRYATDESIAPDHKAEMWDALDLLSANLRRGLSVPQIIASLLSYLASY